MPNIFDMSDDELLALTPEQIQEMSTSSTATSGSTDPGANENADADDEELGEVQGTGEAQGTAGAASAEAGTEGQANQNIEETDDDDTDAGAADADASSTGSATAAKTAQTDAAKADAVDGAVSETPQTPDPKPAEQAAVDYKAEYEKLTAPFTANGREIRVKSVDDAIALMQMGANYNKKMAALKPNLKLLRLLENNGLLNEDKINFLIDLDKKAPGAVNKLIKDSGLDPMDLDGGKADEYKPTTRTVDDREIELDDVLGDIADTPSYQRTIGIVTKEWDVASKGIVVQSPQLLRVINQHVQSGVYDLIKAEVESERMFGRLQGISDIEAYRQVGDAMNARGAFDHLSTQRQQTAAAPHVVTPKPKQVNDEKLNDKRRAAAAAKPAATPPKPAKEFNPLALSDDEFAKMATQKF